jgi:hypothetical protein
MCLGHENYIALKTSGEDLEIVIASILQVPTGKFYRGLFTSSKVSEESVLLLLYISPIHFFLSLFVGL